MQISLFIIQKFHIKSQPKVGLSYDYSVNISYYDSLF